ncbi:MAG TPA: molybdate ABC transporter substrate-binding protein [Pyrinomonadaceae bacterium]|nr:molybdate ABC transporter substrate-binding protein [Pyrinomonadaceae bacterium]
MNTRLILVLILLIAGCQPAANHNSREHGTLTISAAASLKDAFGEVATLYQQQTGDDVVFNFGASGTLQKQIESGASVDVFASAGSKQMDELAAKQLIDGETRRDFAENELVLIVPKDAGIKINGFEELTRPEIKRIAVGNPATVPAGQYARQAFEFMKFGSDFQQKLILAEDVRQVLDYVVRGETDAGVVYKTDALIAGDNVRIVATASPTSHDPIRYPIAVIKDSKQKPMAAKFIDVLLSPAGQAILSKYGFSSVPAK